MIPKPVQATAREGSCFILKVSGAPWLATAVELKPCP
jgi:hypothetical protein